MFRSIDTSTTALLAERVRFDVISNNLANIETTRQPDGTPGPYRRKVPVFMLGSAELGNRTGVHVDRIHEDETDFKVVHNPDHPDADPETGNVQMPNVNIVEEMVDLIEALRSYQANVTAMNATKTMLVNSLDILS